MRKTFAAILLEKMISNENIFVISGDLGFGLFNEIREEFPERFINVGAAEQCMMGVAVGLAMQGRIPFVYSITPFLLWRAAETLRNYVAREQVPVRLVGSGRDDCYKHDGFSHWAGDDARITGLLGIKSMWPDSNEQVKKVVEHMINTNEPFYLNLKR